MTNELHLLSKLLKKSYYEYFKFFWAVISNDDLSLAPYHKYICEELQIIGEHIINKEKCDFDWYLFNIPPGTAKSSMISIIWGTWLLTNSPSIFIINTSYSSTLTDGFVRKSKKILQSEIYKLLFGEIEFTKSTESHYETKQNGGQYSTSTGGTITGQHGNVVIPDDPLSVEESYSKADRDKANRFMTTTLPDRVRDKNITPFVMIMQRLHEEDPTGHILTKDLKIKHVCLPAELGPTTTPGLEYLYTDGLLDPIRMNSEVLKKKKEELGSFGYAGQFDQNPIPKGGGKIKSEWFNYIHEKELPPELTWDMFIDGAYTKNTENDPTGILLTAFKDNNLYLRFAHSDWLEAPDLIKYIIEVVNLYDFTFKSRIFIEPKASGITLKQLLKEHTSYNVIEIKSKLVQDGKEARIQTAAPKVEAGRVTIVIGNWNDEFTHQLEGFPKATHDEYVDLLGYSVDRYFNSKRRFL